MGWYFPSKSFAGINSIGNYYTNVHKSAEAAAHSVVDSARHSSILEGIRGWQGSIFESNLPNWLADLLVNSLSFWRSWFVTADGRWRQWEAYDCADVSNIRNHFERQLPTQLTFPEIEQNIMTTGWGAMQQFSDGRVPNCLANGCIGPIKSGLDDHAIMHAQPCDGVFPFILQLYQFAVWRNDTATLAELWPAAVRAFEWEMNVGLGGTDLPRHQCMAYDIINIFGFDHVSYNAVLYQAALKAFIDMASTRGPTFNVTLVDRAKRAMAAGLVALNRTLWQQGNEGTNSGYADGYFRAYYDAKAGSPPWLQSDVLYGQVWSTVLGLGSLLPAEQIAQHLRTELRRNDGPYGLTIITHNDSSQPQLAERSNTCCEFRDDGPAELDCAKTSSKAHQNTVWMGAPSDWSAAAIALGDTINLTTTEKLETARKSLDQYRTVLRDQWNIHGLTANNGYGIDGQPWCTAHYAFHVTPVWAIPLSLSGQDYDARVGRLRFSPKLSCPLSLPWFTPTGSGVLYCNVSNDTAAHAVANRVSTRKIFKLGCTSGSIEFAHLAVNGSVYLGEIARLEAPEFVEWEEASDK